MSRQFSILTFNTRLFESSLEVNVIDALKEVDVFNVYSDKLEKLIYRDFDRAREIAKRIIHVSADLVCLQEVWGEELRRECFLENATLRNTYPYAYVSDHYLLEKPSLLHPDENNDLKNLINLVLNDKPIAAKVALCVAIEPIFDALRVKGVHLLNGLVVLSKKQLYNCKTVRYDPNKINDPADILGRKGYIQFEVNDPIKLTVGTTHMPTDPEVVCTLAEEPAMSILKNGSQIANTIFLGDLNVHKVYKQGSEYQALKNVMDRACPEALDIVEMSSFQATIWASTLIKAISGNESHGPDDRVDYIYFVPAKTGTSLHPAKVEVIPWWTISGDPRVRELDVSDHRPVLATFTY